MNDFALATKNAPDDIGVLGDSGEIHDEIPTYKDCPIKSSIYVSIDAATWYDIQHIKLNKMKGMEFAVYLLGHINGFQYNITGYYIPEQEVTMTSVEITEDVDPEIAKDIIGHLHSHHTMGVFQSKTDKDHLNYPVHIIVSNEKHSVTVRHTSPCGCILEVSPALNIIFHVNEIDVSKIKQRYYYTPCNKNINKCGKKWKRNWKDAVEENDNNIWWQQKENVLADISPHCGCNQMH